MPFDVAFSLEQHKALAWSVIFGELEGGAYFDWDLMKWARRQD